MRGPGTMRGQARLVPPPCPLALPCAVMRLPCAAPHYPCPELLPVPLRHCSLGECPAFYRRQIFCLDAVAPPGGRHLQKQRACLDAGVVFFGGGDVLLALTPDALRRATCDVLRAACGSGAPARTSSAPAQGRPTLLAALTHRIRPARRRCLAHERRLTLPLRSSPKKIAKKTNIA